MSSLHHYSIVLVTYADVDYTGGTKGQTGFQGLNSSHLQHHLLQGEQGTQADGYSYSCHDLRAALNF